MVGFLCLSLACLFLRENEKLAHVFPMQAEKIWVYFEVDKSVVEKTHEA